MARSDQFLQSKVKPDITAYENSNFQHSLSAIFTWIGCGFPPWKLFREMEAQL